ncbi:MAG: hypothetical protein GY832_24855 [Chloroflexi bacterium]|nr:hypothetical protein [Chloroflexota bacterium]
MQEKKSAWILLTGFGIVSLILGLVGVTTSEDSARTVYWITRGIAAAVAGFTFLVAKQRYPDETTLPTRYRVVVGLSMMLFLFGALLRCVSMFQK